MHCPEELVGLIHGLDRSEKHSAEHHYVSGAGQPDAVTLKRNVKSIDHSNIVVFGHI